MNTYHIDLATGEITQATPVPAGAAHTDDAYFASAADALDPAALQAPEVRRALGDIYQALRTRRFAKPNPLGPDQPSN